MANHKQGKIRQIPVTDPKEGMQVIYNGKIDFLSRLQQNTTDWWNLKGYQKCPVYLRELSQLAIKFETSDFKNGFRTCIIPLKYSQWQKAIDNGEVESDKEVTFEIVDGLTSMERIEFDQKIVKSFYVGNDVVRIEELKTKAKDKQYAKIIPSKENKKLYTEEDMKNAFRTGEAYAEEHATAYGGISTRPYVSIYKTSEREFSEWLQQYNNQKD